MSGWERRRPEEARLKFERDVHCLRAEELRLRAEEHRRRAEEKEACMRKERDELREANKRLSRGYDVPKLQVNQHDVTNVHVEQHVHVNQYPPQPQFYPPQPQFYASAMSCPRVQTRRPSTDSQSCNRPRVFWEIVNVGESKVTILTDQGITTTSIFCNVCRI